MTITPTLTFISSNEGKKQEFERILTIPIQLVHLELEEIQTSDLEVLVKYKLSQARHAIKGHVLVEDTSLEFEAWGKLPGAFIKFFLQEMPIASFEEMLKTQRNMNAKAICVVGLFYEGKELIFKGEIQGKVVAPRGAGGFGWDSIFQPEGATKTFAEMEFEEKQQHSMRQMALEKLNSYLLSNFL